MGNSKGKSWKHRKKSEHASARKLRSIIESPEFNQYQEGFSERYEKNKGGAETKYDGLKGPIVMKILHCLMMDMTVEESVAVANISRTTFYSWCKEHEEFRDAVQQAQEFLFVIAKKNLADHLYTNRRFDQSMEFLSKRQRQRYSSRMETLNKEYHELTDEEKKAIEDVLDKEGL